MSGGRDGSDRTRGRVLAVGIYVTDRENLAPEIVAELGRSRRWSVDQRWVALGEGPAPTALGAVTITRVRTRVPKFALLNRVLEECDLSRYEFVLVCDDDITLPESFVDRYLELVVRHDLALAQPARTHGSYIDHYLVEQLDGLDARRTRFVEIGPLFSIRRDAFGAMLPFDEASPMGWGYDFVWPLVMERAGLRMGIVDATPVDHRIRKPGANYSGPASNRDMKAYLARRPHLAPAQAFSILEAYA